MFRRFKRYSPPGTAPGTMQRPEGPPVASTLELIGYDSERYEAIQLAGVGELPRPEGRGVAWLNVVGHDPDVLEELRGRLDIHPLVMEDVVNVGQRPKMEDYGSYLFIIVDLLRRSEGDNGLDKEQVSLILAPGLLVSIQERPGDVFEPVRARLRASKGRIRGAGTDYLAYALIDAVVDHFFPLLEDMGEDVEELEERLVEESDTHDMAALHRLRRSLLALRKSAWPLREMLSALLRPDTELVTDDTRVFLRDVYDHAVQVIDMIETYREMVSSLIDLYLSSLSNRLNEVMKVLTVIATIFIPLSFIAGVYGMNFSHDASPFNMPELEWRYGYFFALGIMAAVAIGLLGFFRRRRWI